MLVRQKEDEYFLEILDLSKIQMSLKLLKMNSIMMKQAQKARNII